MKQLSSEEERREGGVTLNSAKIAVKLLSSRFRLSFTLPASFSHETRAGVE